MSSPQPASTVEPWDRGESLASEEHGLSAELVEIDEVAISAATTPVVGSGTTWATG